MEEKMNLSEALLCYIANPEFEVILDMVYANCK